jgi:peptidoglycan/xylan/chitin deacetylase (PgdA/CDA1 family)
MAKHLQNPEGCQLNKAVNARLVLTLWIASVSILGILFFVPQWWPWIVGLHLAVQFLVIYPTVRPNCDWFGDVVKTFHTDRNEVWLTIDDGPDPQSTPQILELLARYKARATFFVVGDRVRAYPALTRSIVERGHTLGNHTASHPSASFWASTTKTAAREIDGGAAAIRQAAGIQPVQFRAPVGLANYFVHRFVAMRGMQTIGWSARGYDTIKRDREKIVENIFRNLRPGVIILLHERSRHRETSLDSPSVLESVLERLTAQGYTCIVPNDRQLDGGLF